jgi:hypothetical protein
MRERLHLLETDEGDGLNVSEDKMHAFGRFPIHSFYPPAALRTYDIARFPSIAYVHFFLTQHASVETRNGLGVCAAISSVAATSVLLLVVAHLCVY